ncbi:alkaline phosphatase [Alicyclobacillus cellulosilyticus]|uniref:Alkaline phosphatase n=1 Tax=Alicyclobacillus cellulosilyticus TaxID=1003997 RepID=A0A917K7R4_9BACL|nr:DedA family protein [Alicyclobacillus cellulosilyticus]GGJ04119.1 alkaline phosphatase [Alicyclobacillus cellulosilyticus]
MADWLGWMAEALISLGLGGVFVALVIEGLGLPFPGDAVMVFYGFEAARGQLSLPGVLAACLAGYLTGTCLAYGVSRRFGRPLGERLQRFILLDARSMTRAERLLDRYGAALLVPGRFLPGVRSASSYVAGLCGMSLRPFLAYTALGAWLWCGAWVFAGYWLGDHAAAVLKFSQTWLAYLTGIALVAATALWLLLRRRMAR